MRIASLCLTLVLGASSYACTFYTACPNGGANNSSAGASSSGGTGSAGGSNVVTGPTLTGSWQNVTSNLAGMASECGNLSFVTAKPDEDVLIASVAQHGLWASTDGGGSWKAIGTGKGGEAITNRGNFFVFDPDDPKTYWETGIYNAQSLYVTHDDGDTFQSVGMAHHNDAFSIDLSDPARKTILLSEHETRQKLLLSTDKGATYQEIGANIPSEATVCSYPYILDSKTFLLGCGVFLSGDGRPGIYKSFDTGKTWTSVSPDLGGGSAPLIASDGSIYWAGQRESGLVKSVDKGDTWTVLTGGGIIGNYAPVELPDGRIAAMSASHRHVLVTDDQGKTWKQVTKDTDWEPWGFFYSTFRKAFYAWHFSCTDTLPSDGLVRWDFDTATQ